MLCLYYTFILAGRRIRRAFPAPGCGISLIKERTMPNYYYNSRHGDLGHIRRRRRKRRPGFPFMILLIILLLIIMILVIGRAGKTASEKNGNTVTDSEGSAPVTTESAVERILAQAEYSAAQYDYDTAIDLIEGDPGASESAEGQEAVRRYRQTKASLKRQDVHKITHIFFHTLIMDTSKAFDGDARADGYNDVMTTKSEFEKILESMYERGYVLVSLHDIAHEEADAENGGSRMVEGDIMLPEGKQAFVLSQDDVCYYEYMDGDGFAKDLIIDEDGRIRNEMVMDDGTISVGSYDVVPLLDDFVEKHPDFSYKGAKGCLAVTGYNGVFGYRSDADYEGRNPNIEADREYVKKLSEALRADGWEIASHSWGHRNYATITDEEFEEDTQKWQDRVAPLVGGSDIIMFPFGADVGDWHTYTAENARYQRLWDEGFRYFCNVDSSQYFVQIGDDYLRQGRRNLDGYRMWQDMTSKNRTSDLFDVSEVFDPARPTPVPDYNGG